MSDIYTVKVEESRPPTAQKPSAGPVYRSIYAKDGLLELPAGLESPWQFLRFILYIYYICIHVLHFENGLLIANCMCLYSWINAMCVHRIRKICFKRNG